MKADWPAELALLAACCRWPAGAGRTAAVREAAGRPIDWTRFEQMARHHRVVALARSGLAEAGVAPPPDVLERLRQATSVAARAALASAAETLRLQRLFDEAGLPLLTVKGAPLALLAYGDLGLKQSRDIDLLTTPDHAGAARRLLEAEGYRPSSEIRPATDAAFEIVRAFNIEQEFTHPASGHVVELHWGLMRNPFILEGLRDAPPAQDVPLGRAALRTLADAALYAYLCAHGARHGWARLKWLADLNAFIGRPGSDIGALHEAALRLGAGRTSASALLLCHDVFGREIPDHMREGARADGLIRRLAAHGRRSLTYEARHEDTGHLPLGFKARNHLSRLFLVASADYSRREAAQLWESLGDRLAFPLPPRLAFLYHLARLPLWGVRAGRRALRKVRS